MGPGYYCGGGGAGGLGALTNQEQGLQPMRTNKSVRGTIDDNLHCRGKVELQDVLRFMQDRYCRPLL